MGLSNFIEGLDITEEKPGVKAAGKATAKAAATPKPEEPPKPEDIPVGEVIKAQQAQQKDAEDRDKAYLEHLKQYEPREYELQMRMRQVQADYQARQAEGAKKFDVINQKLQQGMPLAQAAPELLTPEERAQSRPPEELVLPRTYRKAMPPRREGETDQQYEARAQRIAPEAMYHHQRYTEEFGKRTMQAALENVALGGNVVQSKTEAAFKDLIAKGQEHNTTKAAIAEVERFSGELAKYRDVIRAARKDALEYAKGSPVARKAGSFLGVAIPGAAPLAADMVEKTVTEGLFEPSIDLTQLSDEQKAWYYLAYKAFTKPDDRSVVGDFLEGVTRGAGGMLRAGRFLADAAVHAASKAQTGDLISGEVEGDPFGDFQRRERAAEIREQTDPLGMAGQVGGTMAYMAAAASPAGIPAIMAAETPGIADEMAQAGASPEATAFLAPVAGAAVALSEKAQAGTLLEGSSIGKMLTGRMRSAMLGFGIKYAGEVVEQTGQEVFQEAFKQASVDVAMWASGQGPEVERAWQQQLTRMNATIKSAGGVMMFLAAARVPMDLNTAIAQAQAVPASEVLQMQPTERAQSALRALLDSPGPMRAGTMADSLETRGEFVEAPPREERLAGRQQYNEAQRVKERTIKEEDKAKRTEAKEQAKKFPNTAKAEAVKEAVSKEEKPPREDVDAQLVKVGEAAAARYEAEGDAKSAAVMRTEVEKAKARIAEREAKPAEKPASELKRPAQEPVTARDLPDAKAATSREPAPPKPAKKPTPQQLAEKQKGVKIAPEGRIGAPGKGLQQARKDITQILPRQDFQETSEGAVTELHPEKAPTATQVSMHFKANPTHRAIVHLDSGNIYLNPANEYKPLSDASDPVDIINHTREGHAAHEAGHLTYDRMSDAMAKEWTAAHEAVSERLDEVSDPHEEFSDHFAIMTTGKKWAANVAPEYRKFFAKNADALNKIAPKVVNAKTPKVRPRLAKEAPAQTRSDADAQDRARSGALVRGVQKRLTRALEALRASSQAESGKGPFEGVDVEALNPFAERLIEMHGPGIAAGGGGSMDVREALAAWAESNEADKRLLQRVFDISNEAGRLAAERAKKGYVTNALGAELELMRKQHRTAMDHLESEIEQVRSEPVTDTNSARLAALEDMRAEMVTYGRTELRLRESRPTLSEAKRGSQIADLEDELKRGEEELANIEAQQREPGGEADADTAATRIVARMSEAYNKLQVLRGQAEAVTLPAQPKTRAGLKKKRAKSTGPDVRALSANAPSHLRAQLAKGVEAEAEAEFQKTKSAVIAEVQDNLGKKYVDTPLELRDVTMAEKVKQAWVYRVTGSMQLSYESLIEDIAGGTKSKGYQALVERLREGRHMASRHYVDGQTIVNDSMRAAGFNHASLEKAAAGMVNIRLPGGKDLKVSLDEAASLLATSRDPENTPLIQRDGVTFLKQGKVGKLGRMELAALESDLKANHKDFYDFVVSTVKDMVNGWATKLEVDAFKAETGKDLKVHDNYFMRIRDSRHMAGEKAERLKPKPTEEPELRQNRIFKGRTDVHAPLLIRPFTQIIAEHVHTVANYAGKAVPVRDAKRLLYDNGFRQALSEGMANGVKIHEQLTEALEEYKAVDRRERNEVEKWINRVLRRATRAVLSQPQIYAYQLISIENAAQDMPRRYLWNAGPSLSDGQLKAHFPELYQRIKGTAHFLISPALTPSETDAWRLFYGGKVGLLDKMALGPLHAMDSVVINRIITGCIKWAKADGLKGQEMMDEARKRAMRVVDRTQPTFDPITISSLQLLGRKNPALRTAFMFSSQATKNVNMAWRAHRRFLRSGHSPKDFGVWARDTARPTLVNALMIYAMQQGYHALAAALTGQKRESKELWEHVSGVIDRTYGGWLLGRDVVYEVKRAIENEVKGNKPFLGGRPREMLLMSVFTESANWIDKVAALIGTAARKKKWKRGLRMGQSKVPAAMSEAVLQSIRTGSLLFGIPFGLAAERPLRPLLRESARR